ncbi:hypothetical protein [Streptomyces virginiae]|nr:hypothetical protein OG253_41940 [Streptomyces virginiae]
MTTAPHNYEHERALEDVSVTEIDAPTPGHIGTLLARAVRN